jgi:PKD repeat protein
MNLYKNVFQYLISGAIIFLSLFLLFPLSLNAQVFTDFDTDSLEGWRVVGDGQYFLEIGSGNPGNCMRVDDDVTGLILKAIAPPKFIGDWSGAGSADSIAADIFLHQISGSSLALEWIFQISGPGGKAHTLSGGGNQPALDVWTHYSVPIDSNFWTISEGNWNDLISDIDLLEVKAEFISGNEFVRLDNISLSFSPVIIPVMPPVYSEFDQGSFDGWTFNNTAGVSLQSSGGNPSGYIRISDAAGVYSEAYAPPAFLGDWSNLNEMAAIQLDLNILSSTGPFIIDHDLIRISGPGGEATVPYDSSMLKADGEWESFSYLISAAAWNIVWGDWNALLNNVTELVVYPEFFNGSESIGLDNFRITDDPPVADFTAQPRYLFLGDSVYFSDESKFVPHQWMWSFGDGNSSMMQHPIHYYTDAGKFDIQLIATNNFGDDTLGISEYLTVADITDSILFSDNFNNNSIHPAWRFRNGTWVEEEGQMVQTSNHFGPGFIDGAYAIVGSKFWNDYILSMDIKSLDNDRIGFVFRYQDPLNFYLFSWQNEGSARFLKKFVDGIETTLASDGVTYNIGQTYQLAMVSDSSSIKVYVDQVLVFDIDDPTFAMGKAGLYCWGNENSFWDNFKVIQTNFVPTWIEPGPEQAVNTFTLNQNYPNPFNPETVISWQLATGSHVSLTVYDVVGQKVAILVDELKPAGAHAVRFDASGLASGIYYYHIQAGIYQEINKMVLMK